MDQLKGVEYHIHVNHFGENRPHCLANLEQTGFAVRKSVLINGDQESSLWLIAKKVKTSACRDETYTAALKLLKSDTSFTGYIESETVANNNVTTFDLVPGTRPDLCGQDFPMANVTFVSGLKTADIHIYRRKEFPRDQLDLLLEKNGFYEVQTHSKTIWTALLSDVRDAQVLYRMLVGYLSTVRGALEVELEIINEIEIVPKNFSLPGNIKSLKFDLNQRSLFSSQISHQPAFSSP